MKVITLMNQKGGAGKSTVARALLSAADERGLESAFIDADQTGNLSSWAMRASSAGLWSNKIDAFQTIDAAEVEEIVDELRDESKIDLLVLDTAGDASRDHDIYTTVADLILCPILLSRSDLTTAIGTANYLYRMRSRVEDPKLLPSFKVLLNRVGPSPSKGDLLLLDQIRNHPLVGADENNLREQLRLLGTVLTEREAYKTMDGHGLLGRVLNQHNEETSKFRNNPKYMLSALAEIDKLLTACLNEMEK